MYMYAGTSHPTEADAARASILDYYSGCGVNSDAETLDNMTSEGRIMQCLADDNGGEYIALAIRESICQEWPLPYSVGAVVGGWEAALEQLQHAEVASHKK